MSEPSYADHFTSGGVFRLWREGMYGIRETYDILRWLGGYDLHYVNVGYWPEGLATQEPGRRMALLHGEMLGLKAGDRLLDCGSGLGQGAIDHVKAFDLAEVLGINPSGQQVGFARQLVAAHGLSDKISFVQDDACKVVYEVEPGKYQHAMAVECFSYFPDKLAFLNGLKKSLAPGGKFCFADVCSSGHMSKSRRRALGLVSNAESHPVEYFVDLYEKAGFKDIQHRDITNEVIPHAIGHARKRLAEDPSRLRKNGFLVDKVVRSFIDFCDRSFSERESTYDILVGTIP